MIFGVIFPTLLELGTKKGLIQAFHGIQHYNFSKSLGMSMTLFHNILYDNGQTWIDLGDKDLNFSQIRGQKGEYEACIFPLSRQFIFAPYFLSSISNFFCWIPYESPCLSFSMRFLIYLIVFVL